jgi:hydrogenase maturation protease
MTDRTKTLILGIGNILLQDEGAGIHAIRLLADMTTDRRDIELMDGGTLSFSLAGAIEDTDQLIVIDAAHYDGEVGTTKVFTGEQMDEFIGSNRRYSVHEVSLIDLLVIALLTRHLPRHRALIGIQPRTISWGETLSPPVANAVKLACHQALQLIEDWRT